jgi:hypothetical protein
VLAVLRCVGRREGGKKGMKIEGDVEDDRRTDIMLIEESIDEGPWKTLISKGGVKRSDVFDVQARQKGVELKMMSE